MSMLCCLLFLSIFTGDVFSDVGPIGRIAISVTKKVKHVYANDLNPCVVEYLEGNCILNKLEREIEEQIVTTTRMPLICYTSYIMRMN